MILPKLEYDYDTLEPYIDAKTMEIHYTKHHQAYIDKLNEVIDGTEFESMEARELIMKLDELLENIKDAVRNNGGGHINRSY